MHIVYSTYICLIFSLHHFHGVDDKEIPISRLSGSEYPMCYSHLTFFVKRET